MDVPQFVYPFPVEEYLGSLQILVITNKAIINIYILNFFVGNRFLFLLGKYLGVGSLGCIVSVCLTIGNSNCLLFPPEMYASSSCFASS